MAESKEELKSLLMKARKESEKADLKFNIQKTKIMATSPIVSWQTDEETMETVTDFIFLGYKITEEGMATHSSVIDWRLPKDRGARWARVLGGHRVRNDWAIKHSTKSLKMVTAAMKLKDPCSLEEKLWQT